MSTPESLLVRHSRGEYTVRMFARRDLIDCLADETAIITDEGVLSTLPELQDASVPILALAPGEGSKCVKKYAEIAEWLLDQRVHRRSRLVALGGGVMGDLAGFVAATYMRGIPYVQVPTTLLAMVDSSVGGKVAVDLPAGKNLLGAFWPPEEVWLCPELLSTLPERQMRNGMAEVLKYGAILDGALFSELVRRPVRAHDPRLPSLIMRCIELKRQVVEADEYETLGLRAVLNFGHTIGHAIEQVLGYEKLLHGEAVAIGMVAESRLGERLGVTDLGTTELLAQSLQRQGLPTALPEGLASEQLLPAMYRDKKAAGGSLSFSLLTRIGECKLISDVPETAVRSVLPE